MKIFMNFDNDKNHIPWFDFVRSLAILLVLLSHSRGWLLDYWEFAELLKFGGYIGVELFFSLSGILVGSILLKTPLLFDFEQFKRFLVRRWYRTLPNYYLWLGIVSILAFFNIRDGWTQFNFGYLVFTQN